MLGKDFSGKSPELEEEDASSEKVVEKEGGLLVEKLQHLPKDMMKSLMNVMLKTDVAAESFHDLHQADVPIKHAFELTNDTPISHSLRRLPPRHNEILRGEFVKMLDPGIYNPSASGWYFPVVIVSKKDGTPRFYVDYRSLNSVMKPYKWPLPRIKENFDELAGGQWLTTLDLFSSYWKIMLQDGVKEENNYIRRFRNLNFEVIPFDLMNTPSKFQRLMDELFKDIPFNLGCI